MWASCCNSGGLHIGMNDNGKVMCEWDWEDTADEIGIWFFVPRVVDNWVLGWNCDENGRYYDEYGLVDLASRATMVKVVDANDPNKGAISSDASVIARVASGEPLERGKCDQQCIESSWSNIGSDDTVSRMYSTCTCDHWSFPEGMWASCCNSGGLHIGMNDNGKVMCEWDWEDTADEIGIWFFVPQCCVELTAECLSCQLAVTVEDFCNSSPSTPGCTPECCVELTAECLSCQLALTMEEFCNASPSTPGCTQDVDPCLEYNTKGACRRKQNCVWSESNKKCTEEEEG